MGIRLSRKTDNADWQLATRIFYYYDKQWGSHTIDRFTFFANKQLPRYTAKWRDGKAEDLDSIQLPDREWRQEKNRCNPPWSLLDDLTAKLRRSGAEATVIAPKWPRFPWFVHLSEIASEVVEMPPSKNLFSPQRREGHGGCRAFRLERRGIPVDKCNTQFTQLHNTRTLRLLVK